MKKIFGLFSVALAALGLASCGNGGAKEAFICPDEFDTETPVEVTFWHTQGDNLQEVLNEAVEEFTALYPNVTIIHEQIGGYPDVRDQIITNLGTGGYPSIAYCYADHVALYNEAEITVSLDNLMSNSKYGFGGSEVKYDSPAKEDIVEGFMSEGSNFGDGLTYTLPFLRSTEALFYNKDFFEEHNLQLPQTWDDMWALCAQIKQIDPNSTPLGYDSEANLFITLAEAYGYGYTSAEDGFLFDNDGMRGLMKTFKENYDKGYFTTETIYQTYTNTLMTDVTLNTRAYMCIGSTAGATYQVNSNGAFETGVTSVPKAPGKELKTISQGPSLVLFNKTNTQEVLAAWLFSQYLLTPTVQARFALASGYLPVSTPATEIKEYQDFLAGAAGNKNGIAALSTKQALAQKASYYSSAVFNGSSVARDEVGNLFVKIMTDKSINSGNIDSKIKGYFEAAIEECIYQSE